VLHNKVVYMPQTVTHSSINRARCGVTSLIKIYLSTVDRDVCIFFTMSLSGFLKIILFFAKIKLIF